MKRDLRPVERVAAAEWSAGARGGDAPDPDWRAALPVLSGERVVLRELRQSDAAPLLEMLGAAEVARFISPPPASADGFERFIEWTHAERAAGRHICFGVVPKGLQSPAGIFQIRQVDLQSGVAEWGFAIGSAFWGTGMFMDAANVTLGFAFETVGVTRLEARAAVPNGRGNGALAKIGAVREAVLRSGFRCQDGYVDQALWSILREDWRQSKAVWGAAIH